MIKNRFSECLLETECDNYAALNLYEKLGFRRTEYLPRYYQNGNSAYRLVDDCKLGCLFFHVRWGSYRPLSRFPPHLFELERTGNKPK